MSSFRVISKLANSIGNEDGGNTSQRYLQSPRGSRPKSKMSKSTRSNLHAAEPLHPFTASHERNAQTREQIAQSYFASPEGNGLHSATRKQLPCSCPQACPASSTAVFTQCSAGAHQGGSLHTKPGPVPVSMLQLTWNTDKLTEEHSLLNYIWNFSLHAPDTQTHSHLRWEQDFSAKAEYL